jgi:lipoprotein-releasing system ATP-binding protein
MMLSAAGVHKAYHNGKNGLEVLKGIDLEIGSGEFAAITGPSGAGKSTLLHILGGLDSPTRGRVTFEGKDLYGLSDVELSLTRNSRFGFVFQFYHLLPEFTALENVLMPALICRADQRQKEEARRQASGLLRQVGLGERSGHFPAQLSGGEKQRVAIARALINQPQFLFCDEPTGNLDSQSGAEIVRLLKDVNARDKAAVVLVTHNLELAKIADRVYHLRDGILVNFELPVGGRQDESLYQR